VRAETTAGCQLLPADAKTTVPEASPPEEADASVPKAPLSEANSSVPEPSAVLSAVPSAASSSPSPSAGTAAAPTPRPDVPPLRIAGGIQAGKILTHPAPIYPAVARTASIQGLVRLEAVITKDGTVRDLKVLSGNPMLAEAARDAVRRWRYQPAKLDGEPIEVRTDIDVDFKLP